MERVMSSHVFEIGYDEETRVLSVRYAPELKYPAGRVVRYIGVEPEVADQVVPSRGDVPSVGSALHRLIRGRPEYPTEE